MAHRVPELEAFLDSLRRMGIAPGTERRILRELYQHLEEEVRDLEVSGMPREEAVRRAIARFGPPREIARGMADIYARSSLGQAVVGAAPHGLIAVSFLFHLWQKPSWVVFLAALTGGMALYGWARGKPSWFYTWLGFALAATLALLFLGMLVAGWGAARGIGVSGSGLWVWGVVAVYIPASVAILVTVARQVARQDWLHASLMALPLPPLAWWAFRLNQQGRLVEEGQYRLQDMDGGMALIMAAAAISVMVFLRLKERHLKVCLLLATAVGVLAAVVLSGGVHLNVPGFALVAFALVVMLLSPALLDQEGGGEEVWATASQDPSYAGEMDHG